MVPHKYYPFSVNQACLENQFSWIVVPAIVNSHLRYVFAKVARAISSLVLPHLVLFHLNLFLLHLFSSSSFFSSLFGFAASDSFSSGSITYPSGPSHVVVAGGIRRTSGVLVFLIVVLVEV